jgi:uncharacterized spore protein YtfJ
MDAKQMVDTKPIEKAIESLSASSVFGEPTSEHGVVVIPVAQVAFGFGYDKAGKGTPEDAGATGEGAGGGGGAGGRVTPRGYIRISQDGVTYESIEDEKVIPLAGILMVAWSVFWIAATIRFIARQVGKTRQTRIKSGL